MTPLRHAVTCCRLPCSQVASAVQPQHCAQVQQAPDKEELCQQAAARDGCHRTCDLCDAGFDSSSLVWYNQPQTVAAAAQAWHASRDANISHGVELPGREGIMLATTSSPSDVRLEEVGAAAGAGHAGAGHKGAGHAGGHSSVDKPVMQQGQVNSSAVEHEHVAGSAGKLNGTTGTVSKASEAAGTLTSDVDSNALGRTQSWQRHIGNPFCSSLLCLCLLLFACVLWLAKTKLRRKRILH